MNKYFRWIAAFLIMGTLFGGFLGCKQEPEIKYVEVEKKGDEIVPTDVTELVVVNKDASVLLTWNDATDEDIFGYEVSWNKTTPINKSAAMEANSMMVAPGSEGCFISNLVNGTEYTFTVKSVDTSGNKSEGVKKTITPTAIEKSPLQITLTPNTTEKTNHDIVIDVTAESTHMLKAIAYKQGTIAKVEEVLAGTDITTTKEIVVSTNGTYTVAATDTAGRRELAFITIENIDKTAPDQVGNVVATYSSKGKKISLSWTNPTNSDFNGTIISYCKKDSVEATTIECDKETNSKVIENIATDESEYTISIATKDDVGNIGAIKTVCAKATLTADVTNINLDRTHLDSIMSNRDIKVTISGSNFDLLSSLLVQVTDGTTAQTPITALIDKENNIALATVTAPVPSVPTVEGTTYTVKVIVDNTTPAETTAEFVVSKPSDVTEITLAQTQIPVGTQENVRATIKGYNFDIRGITKIKLLDSNGEEYTESTVVVPLEANTSEEEFTVKIPVPTESGVYTVTVFFDEICYDIHSILQVYGNPVISEISIPVAGESYFGNKIPVTIRGKNFTAPNCSFTGDGAGITNFKIISDTKGTAEVTCPYVTGTTTVTVKCGDVSKDGTLKVVPTEKCFSYGDIILTDGTRISVNDVNSYTIDESNKPIGVIGVLAYGGGTGKVIGLNQSEPIMWAPKETTGYNTEFTNIVCNPSDTYLDAALTTSFTGDIDGSDNWEEICAVDPVGTQDAASNYPVFNFANTYAETAGLTGTSYEKGWYVPSLAELCEVYRKKEVIQTSLTTASGFTIQKYNPPYWSSSQYSGIYIGVYALEFGAGHMQDWYKLYDGYVFVLQALNAQ